MVVSAFFDRLQGGSGSSEGWWYRLRRLALTIFARMLFGTPKPFECKVKHKLSDGGGAGTHGESEEDETED